MYAVTVRDHIMIAHSFRGAVFGPAQSLHGGTFIVDAEFRRPELDPDNIVVDIGLAHTVLRDILGFYNYRNLDGIAEFRDVNTTTEFLSRDIHRRIADAIAAGKLGPHAGGLTGLKVTLRESHVAQASFDGDLV